MKNLRADLQSFNPSVSHKTHRLGGSIDIGLGANPKIDDYKIPYSTKLWHLTCLLCLVTVVGIAFLARSYDLQIFLSNKYLTMSASNTTRFTQIQPERGVIYARDGSVLARNKPAFSVEMTTMYCNQLRICATTAKEVLKILGLPDDVDEAVFDRQVVVLAEALTKEQVLTLETQLLKFPGVTVTVQPQRDYLYSEEFSHVLGYIGLDDKSLQPKYIGRSGVEQSYEEYLQGIPGERVIRVDSSGGSYEVIAEQNSLPGKNLHTFLDTELQTKAYELLKQRVEDKKAAAGVVVAQDPQTGGILALVNYPSFDVNKMAYGMDSDELEALFSSPSFPFFNRAVAGAYPPGSTFKMVTASAALSEKVVSKHTTVFDPGYLQVGSYVFRNWKVGGHGEVNLLKALQVSNDTYFYTVGGGYGGIKGVGIEKLASWAGKFGYGKLSGVDIEGEVAGNMPNGTARAWYLGDTYITSIGQGDVLSTPLQVNNVTAYFANGGFLLKPRVVKSVDGVAVSEREILDQKLIINDDYELIRQGMRAVAAPGGTAYPLFDFAARHEGVELGAKTGTSEYTDSTGEDKTHAWLTVFGPYDDATIALTVFLEGGGAGSDDATPIAKELLDIWFRDK